MDIEQQAQAMGWKPLEQFKGPEDKWVDAAEYVRRGEEVLPIVRNENRRLQETVGTLKGEIGQLQTALRESQTSMTEFKQFQTEMLQTKLKEQRAEILAEIRAAREAGEDDRIVALEEQLDENREATREAKEAKPAATTPQSGPPPLTAEQQATYASWESANAWINGTTEEDMAKQGAATRFGQLAAQQGKLGKAFFDFVDEKMAKAFPDATPTSKTEDARPSGGGGGKGKTTFAALPADAKAYVEERASQFVGPNKMFKTMDAWQAHYAKVYFAQESEAV